MGKDVAQVLGYGNARQALKTNVDDDDKGVQQMDTPGGTQEMIIINESGLYEGEDKLQSQIATVEQKVGP